MLFRERKSNRLKNFDYSSSGYYFVTICTKNREEHFGGVAGGKMILNEYGKIIKKQWLWLGLHFNYILLDEYVIMPNHFHGIVIIKNNPTFVGTGRDLSLRKKSLSGIIGAFKTTTSKGIHLFGFNSFQWQRSFYDHIIRNEYELNRIREYIRNNPRNWQEDENNLKNS